MSVNYKVAVLENFEWQRPVLDKDILNPSGLSPIKGDKYLIAGTGAGNWNTKDNQIALCTNATGPVWEYVAPTKGMQVWVKDENLLYIYKGSNWTSSVIYSKSFIVSNPIASVAQPIWRTSVTITITAIHVLCIGGTNIVGMLDECDSNGLNPVPVDDTDITGIADTNTNDDGTLNNPTIDAGDFIGWHTTSVDGIVTRAIITFEYTIN